MNKFAITLFAMIGISAIVALYSSENVNATEMNKKRNIETVYVQKSPPVQEIKKPEKGMQRWYEGTLNYYDIEGGFFGFTSKDGDHLLPMGLDKKYHQPGARLKLFGYIDDSVATIQMWGKPFQVIKVEVLEKGGKTHPSQM